MNDCLIRADRINRWHADFHAVRNVDLNVKRGESVAVLGSNGAGKSTLLAVLAGSLAAHSGGVTINGHDLKRQPLAARRSLGFMPERPPLYNELRVREYLMFCSKLRLGRGLTEKGRRSNHTTQITEAADRAIEDFALQPVANKAIGNLSLGFRSRVGIAQATLHSPPVLILDEPTIGLDPNQLDDLRGHINRHRAEHAIIFSSHTLSEVRALCGRVVILDRGGIVDQFDLGDDADERIARAFAKQREATDDSQS